MHGVQLSHPRPTRTTPPTPLLQPAANAEELGGEGQLHPRIDVDSRVELVAPNGQRREALGGETVVAEVARHSPQLIRIAVVQRGDRRRTLAGRKPRRAARLLAGFATRTT